MWWILQNCAFYLSVYFPYTLWECCRECANSALSYPRDNIIIYVIQMQKMNLLNFLVWFCSFFLQLSRISSPLILLYIRSINWWNEYGYLSLHSLPLVKGSFIQQAIFLSGMASLVTISTLNCAKWLLKNSSSLASHHYLLSLVSVSFLSPLIFVLANR